MMSDLRELYQEVIIQHGAKPRNFSEMPHATCSAKGHNPLCGDDITLYLLLDGDVIKDISFQGQGCAISMASASLMSEGLKGKTLEHAEQLFTLFHQSVTADVMPVGELGKLAVLTGVREFPARVKCATLAWHTLQNALEHNTETATTE